ncbi:MAG TPA: DDE-type integrase/transposase/recombinase, partial [Pedobacter sp.]
MDLTPPISLNVAAISPPGLTDLWHKRFGHLNYQSLFKFSRQGIVTGLPILKKISSTCEPCILGKQHIQAIPRQSFHQTSRPLELIHSDLCGPFPHRSLKGSRYVLTFIDDYSRHTWVYFLATKDETFSIFQNFQHMAEKQTSLAISCLRTDRGGEYLSNAFNTYCDQQGIRRHLTNASTPQQNGKAERKNRHLCETMRTLLLGSNLPTSLWEEAIRASNYIMNRMPHRALYLTTPMERFSGHKPDVSHLRVFGCRAYIHIKTGNKLQPKSLPSTLIGYDDQSKAYRCFDSTRSKILISRDVLFNEEILGIPSHVPANTSDYEELHEFLLYNGTPVLAPIIPGFTPTANQPPQSPTLPPAVHSTMPGVEPPPPLGPKPVPKPLESLNSRQPEFEPSTSTPGPSPTTYSRGMPQNPSSFIPMPIAADLLRHPTPSAPPAPPALEPVDLPHNVSQPPLRRSTRLRKQSVKLDDFILSVTPENFDICLTEKPDPPELFGDDISYREASKHTGWVNAMRDEMNSIHRNEVWDLVSLPPG